MGKDSGVRGEDSGSRGAGFELSQIWALGGFSGDSGFRGKGFGFSRGRIRVFVGRVSAGFRGGRLRAFVGRIFVRIRAFAGEGFRLPQGFELSFGR